MAKFIQVNDIADPKDHKPVIIGVEHIIAIEPIWRDDGGEWTHTYVYLGHGHRWKTDHLPDEFDEAMQKDAFVAIVARGYVG